MASRKNTIADLRERLASWEAVERPQWLRDVAPGIVAQLKAEIARRVSA